MKEMKKVFSRYNLADAFREQEVLLFWEKVVGATLAKFSQASRFEDGTLVIIVASSAVASELRMLETQLIKRLNQHCERSLVTRLRVMPGKLAHSAEPSQPRSRLESPDPTPEPEDLADMQDIEDPRLREAFARIRRGGINRDATRLQSGATRCPRCGIVFWGSGRICPGCLYDGFEERQDRE